MAKKTPEERLGSIETSIKNIEGFVKEIKEHGQWKDTCKAIHEKVEVQIQHNKKKACAVDRDLEDHKKDDKKSSQFQMGIGITVVGLVITTIITLYISIGG